VQQMRTGHCPFIGAYRSRFNLICKGEGKSDGKCILCGDGAEESVSHFRNCRRRFRRKPPTIKILKNPENAAQTLREILKKENNRLGIYSKTNNEVILKKERDKDRCDDTKHASFGEKKNEYF